jgi:hypothetical protein
MKLTLDHNVVIDLANGSPRIERVRKAIADGSHQVFVVEVGASEMCQRGIEPDRYDLFEQLLQQAGIDSLPRLAPMMIWDVTFWDHGLWSDEQMSAQAKAIEDILFGESLAIDITAESDNSPEVARWLNRICDVQSMWCHLHYQNDIFVTSDSNFSRPQSNHVCSHLGLDELFGRKSYDVQLFAPADALRPAASARG